MLRFRRSLEFIPAARFCAFVCLTAGIINHTNRYTTTELAAMLSETV
jgi:hypothetical protein